MSEKDWLQVKNIFKQGKFGKKQRNILSRLGFEWVSCNKHYKFKRGDIVFVVSCTPSDRRSNLNNFFDMKRKCKEKVA